LLCQTSRGASRWASPGATRPRVAMAITRAAQRRGWRWPSGRAHLRPLHDGHRGGGARCHHPVGAGTVGQAGDSCRSCMIALGHRHLRTTIHPQSQKMYKHAKRSVTAAKSDIVVSTVSRRKIVGGTSDRTAECIVSSTAQPAQITASHSSVAGILPLCHVSAQIKHA
jgi:hypothetical protein